MDFESFQQLAGGATDGELHAWRHDAEGRRAQYATDEQVMRTSAMKADAMQKRCEAEAELDVIKAEFIQRSSS